MKRMLELSEQTGRGLDWTKQFCLWIQGETWEPSRGVRILMWATTRISFISHPKLRFCQHGLCIKGMPRSVSMVEAAYLADSMLPPIRT